MPIPVQFTKTYSCQTIGRWLVTNLNWIEPRGALLCQSRLEILKRSDWTSSSLSSHDQFLEWMNFETFFLWRNDNFDKLLLHFITTLNEYFLVVVVWLQKWVKRSNSSKNQGGNSQKFLRKICKIFLHLRCFYEAVTHRKNIIYDFSNIVNINLKWYLLQKYTFSLKKDFKALSYKNLKNLP